MPFHLPSTFVLVFAAFVTTCSAFSPRVILHGLPKAPLLARGTLSAASKFRCPAFLVSHQRSAIGRVRCVAINSVEDVSEDLVPPPLKQNAPSKISVMVEPTPFTHISGYSNRYKEMLDYLHAAGDQVSIMCPDDTVDPPSEYKGSNTAPPGDPFSAACMHILASNAHDSDGPLFHRFPITYTPGFRFALYNHICLSVDHTFTGMKMLKENRPELLHISTPGFIVLVATIYAKMMRIPVVMSYHTHLPVYADRYMGFMPFIVPIAWLTIKFIHNYADLTLVTSPQMKSDFLEHGVKRVEVWRKGINTENFNPKWRCDSMRDLLSGGNPEDTIILYVGRLGREKRIQDLRPVLDANPHLRLALVGQGPYKSDLEEIFKGTNTIFTGVLKGQPLWEAFASADIMVMPSDSETLGFVVLESLASGVPVVGADAGGLPDLIKDGENGFLVPPGDFGAIGERVRRLSEDKELRDQMGRNGRKFAELWSWESATSVLRNIQYPMAKANHKRWRESTSRYVRGLQTLGLALVGIVSTSIVGLGCILDLIWAAMTNRKVAKVD